MIQVQTQKEKGRHVADCPFCKDKNIFSPSINMMIYACKHLKDVVTRNGKLPISINTIFLFQNDKK